MKSYLALVALLVSGCVAPAPDPAPPAGLADSASANTNDVCGSRLLLEDDQDLATGGSGEAFFELRGLCALSFDLQVSRLVGDLRITVAGPSGAVFDYDRSGVEGPGASIITGGGQSSREGRSPPGTYRYSFNADTTAAFALRIEQGSGATP